MEYAKKFLTIALDYDGTFTADPEFWLKFIDEAKNQGHTVICVTMRYEHELDDTVFNEKLKKAIKIIPTGRKAKKKFLATIGQKIDIWIDDQPDFLYEDAR